MKQLSSSGQQAVNDIAQRHGFSLDATASMLEAVRHGNGRMAQFNHAEFGGAGQWMSGGMTMVSDMFNHQVKGRVSALCSELSSLLARHAGGAAGDGQATGHPSASLFAPSATDPSTNWWPSDLRGPSSTGAQDGLRYAYFAQARRLAIEMNGELTVYDTQDHQIGGFAQQQSGGGTATFSSQHGPVDVSRLPVVALRGVQQATGDAGNAGRAPEALAAGNGAVFQTLEKLADLRSRGLVTDEKFHAKKTELLARL